SIHEDVIVECYATLASAGCNPVRRTGRDAGEERSTSLALLKQPLPKLSTLQMSDRPLLLFLSNFFSLLAGSSKDGKQRGRQRIADPRRLDPHKVEREISWGIVIQPIDDSLVLWPRVGCHPDRCARF